MSCFEKLTDRIYRLKIPFENIYTAVFLIKHDGGFMLVDSAATSDDARIILDALKEASVTPESVSHILITHAHGDHAGGLCTLSEAMPLAVVCAGSDYLRRRLSLERFELVSDGQEICGGIVALSLSGHSADSFGYLDREYGVLISGDAVQLCGVGRYGTGLSLFDEYLRTLDKIDCMRLDMLICSHDYYPHGAIATREDIKEYIEDSRRYAQYIISEADSFVDRGIFDAIAVCERIRAKNTTLDPNIPPLQVSSVRAYLNTKK